MSAVAPGPRHILRYGDRRLRRTCRPVDAGESDVEALANEMWRLMTRDGGVGLAAPQVGDLRRLIVVKDPRRRGSANRLVLINPHLSDLSADVSLFEEGCLSFPGLYFRLRRPSAVTVVWRDLAGRPKTLAADGLLARVIQHEIDHLDGVLFVDHLSTWRRRLLWWRIWRSRWLG